MTSAMDAANPSSEPRPPERNVKLVVQYDGTDYQGFQMQAGDVPTIQLELERGLLRVTGRTTRVAGAGRTDSGVHALGQVVSFRTDATMSVDVLRRAMNAVLPKDIAVVDAGEMPAEFHARFSAQSREYRYGILNRLVRAPLERRYVWHVPEPLDVAAMALAAQELVGEHDFASFAGAVAEPRSTRRCVLAAACSVVDDRIYVTVQANAFLPHMVRNIVGSLMMVGKGKLDVAGFRDVLSARKRHTAGPMAPARGLCLMRVNY